MPTFDDIFLEVFNTMTLGFVTDLKTALVAFVVLGFTLFGFEKLLLIFQSRVASASFQRASGYADMRDGYSSGSAGYDYYNALYRKQLNQAVSFSKADSPSSLFSVAPEEPEPFTFRDGSSPETPSFSAESDWESASLSGGGYVGFAVSETEDADRSDWTLVQQADITGLDVDHDLSFSSDRSDWTSMQEADITGLEVDSSSSFSSDRSDWTSFQDADIIGLSVETPEDLLHHVLDNFSSFSDAEVFSAIDGLDGHSSSLSDWTAVQDSDITGLEMEPSSFSISERSDWTAFNDISFDGSRAQIVSSANFSDDLGPADDDRPGWA